MKKLILATLLAATSGLVSAKSQVEISGYIREFMTDIKTGSSASVTGITNDAPSSITVRGSEDLGNGLKARFTIQTGVITDAPTTGADTQIGNHHMTVGFVNKHGSIDMGRQKHAQRLVYSAVDPFLVAGFSTQVRVHNVQGSRLNNAIYAQANLGKFVVKYDHGFSEVNGIDATNTFSVSTTVAGVIGTMAYFKDDSVNQNKSTVGSLATTIPGTKTRIAGVISKDETIVTSANAWSTSAIHPIGKFDLKAAYGQRDLDSIKSYTVGVAYNFSKRTNVEVIQLKTSANTVANNVRMTGIGINHRF